MSKMQLESVFFECLKCFSGKAVIERPSLFNLIIGKNNSGKSTVLEGLSWLYSSEEEKVANLKPSSIGYKTVLTKGFVDGYSSSFSVGGLNDFLYERKVEVRIPTSGSFFHPECSFVDEKPLSFRSWDGTTLKPNMFDLGNEINRSVERGHIDCIAAERNIVEEEGKSKSVEIRRDGKGITNWLYSKLNSAENRNEKVKPKLLKYLNDLLCGESVFENIQVLQNKNTNWEVYLTENGNHIPLSEMGSGIKTLLFVVVLLTKYEIGPKEKTFFLFEELENNLHPKVFRRLLEQIYDFSVKNSITVFVTSHSSSAIDFFYDKPDSSIYHVSRNKDGSSIRLIDNAKGRIDLLSDLGIRPSDILLSNGIIWVEGPSDRIYINKWIGVVDDSLVENRDYSFMYYGGRILSHYSLEESKDLLSILKTNTNSAIVMDSDKRSDDDEINETKKRVLDDFKKHEMLCWVTEGKEIENYLFKNDINRLPVFQMIEGKKTLVNDNNELPQVGQYEDFKTFIEPVYARFESNKVQFSKDIKMTADSLSVLDLKDRIEELVKTINKWKANA